MRNKTSLHRTWQRVRTVPGLGRHLTAVVVVIILGLSAITIIFSKEKFIPPWADQYEFAADFVEAPAVNPSQRPEVRIAGVEVGQVIGSDVTSDGHARLRFSLEPGHKVYENARVVLRPKNPLNEMYVEIEPGGSPARPLPPDGVIPVGQTERPIQPDEVLQHLDERSRSAVTNLLAASDAALANAPERLPEGVNATNSAMTAYRPVLEKLDLRRQKIAELVTALSQIATAVGGNNERVGRLADALHRTLGTLSTGRSDLRTALAELPKTTSALREAMNGVQQLSDELDPALDNLHGAADKLPPALGDAGDTVDTAGDVIRAARPVVGKLRPLATDLRPLVRDVDGALDHLQPVTRRLGPVTKQLVPYLNDLQAFVFNTSSVFSPADVNGGFIRGHLVVPLPDGGVIPGSHGGNSFPDSQREDD